MKLFNLFKAFKAFPAETSAKEKRALTASVLNLGQVSMTVLGSGLTGLGDAIVDDRRRSEAG